jgi:hypothetical protein
MADMSQYGNQAAINRQRALAEALMVGAMGGQSGMPQQGGRIASAAGLGAVIGPMAQALMSSRLSRRADAGEAAMKDAYAKAMQEYTAKGMQALQGTPQQTIPGAVGVRPTNDPMAALMGYQKSGYVDQLLGGLKDFRSPDTVVPGTPSNPALAASYFAKNPETKSLADELMKQAAQQYAPVDASKYMPYMTGQGAAKAMPQGGLTNANLGEFLAGGFAGGGMPKIEGDRMIDQGTGSVGNLPMTANQKATADYNQGMLGYNQGNLQRQWAELNNKRQEFAIESALRRQGLSNEQVRLQMDAMKADPAYQARVAAEIEKAKSGVALEADRTKSSGDAMEGIKLLGEIETLIPKTSDSMIGRGGRYFAAMFGGGGETRAADADLRTKANQLALYAQRFPGVQTDKDYERMLEQVGVMSGINATQEEKQAAARAAGQHFRNIISRFGTPEQKAALVESMRAPSVGGGAGAGGWSIQRVE